MPEKYVHKENRGTLFPESDRATERHPTHKGKCNVGGVLYYFSAWLDASNGRISLSVGKRVEDRPEGSTWKPRDAEAAHPELYETPKPQAPTAQDLEDLDDVVPF